MLSQNKYSTQIMISKHIHPGTTLLNSGLLRLARVIQLNAKVKSQMKTAGQSYEAETKMV